MHDNIDPDANFFDPLHETNDPNSTCKYYTVSEFHQLCENSFMRDRLLIMSINTRSFSNFWKFEAILSSKAPPDVLVVSETWFKSESTVNLPNYSSYHVCRPSGRGGGISIFVRDNLQSSAIDSLSYQNATIEITTTTIILHGQKIIILGVYRPHSDSIENFTATMNDILNSPLLASRNVVLTGDLNLNLLNIDQADIGQFVHLMQSFHYLPRISKPTRFSSINSSVSATCLDHFWSNFAFSANSGVISIDITDHCPIFLAFPIAIDKSINDKTKITFRDLSSGNKIIFSNKISEFDWTGLFCTDVSRFTQGVLSTLDAFFKDSFPIKCKFISKKRLINPWMNSECLELIKLKSEFFKRFKRKLITPVENNAMKNLVNSKIRKAKRDYFKFKFNQYRCDARKTWNMIKNLLGVVKGISVIKSIFWNNTVVTDDFDVAECFNSYFSSVAAELDVKIPQSSHDPLAWIPSNDSTFNLSPASSEEISAVINNLKNTKSGLDVLPVKTFKENINTLKPVMLSIVNQCFSTGCFPRVLKLGIVTPIFKKGDKSMVSNYRPITCLHYFSKIIERILYNRVNEYFINNALLHENQFGFRRGRSTEHAILKMLDFMYDAVDRKNYGLAVLIDYKKAFDTINHLILGKKLLKYGVGGNELSLIIDYIADRPQKVRIGSTLSNTKTLNIGLPQGSVLSPLLFIIYINDLNFLSDNFTPILFADDTTLLFQNNSYNDLIDTCNAELIKFKTWTETNRLSLNVLKTHVLFFTYRSVPSTPPEIFYGNTKLEIKNQSSFLGVIVDNKLKFNLHVKQICNKLSKSIGIIYKLKDSVPTKILINLYYSFAYPYLQYCNTTFSNTYNCHLEPLQVLQKRLLRLINNVPYLSHTNELFHKNSILKLKDINIYCTGIYVYKNIDSFPSISSHNYNTRNHTNLRSTFQRTSVTQQNISHMGPRIWNSIPPNIRSLPSINSFKRNLKLHLLSNYRPPETNRRENSLI